MWLKHKYSEPEQSVYPRGLLSKVNTAFESSFALNMTDRLHRGPQGISWFLE